MKKNGFIATSILYSFFLVFITLFVALITNYLHNQVLMAAIDEKAWNTLNSINNTKLSDLKVGEHIKFANIPAPESSYSYTLNENATWVVAHIIPSADGKRKTYYLMSDFSAPNLSVMRRMPGDPPVAQPHTLTIDVMKFLGETTHNDGYKDDMLFYVSGKGNGIFTNRDDFKVGIPKASIIREVSRSTSLNNDIKNEILGVKGDYPIYIDGTSQGGFTSNTYALLRRYNFPMGAYQGALVEKYCAAKYDGSNLTYTGKYENPSMRFIPNDFGYTHVVDESVNKKGTIKSYVDYCIYASPIEYTHESKDQVVERNVTRNDKIMETFMKMDYQARLMAEITVNVDSEYTYVSGGRGTSLDPYLMTNGVQVK